MKPVHMKQSLDPFFMVLISRACHASHACYTLVHLECIYSRWHLKAKYSVYEKENTQENVSGMHGRGKYGDVTSAQS
jgi:hypothetical protein